MPQVLYRESCLVALLSHCGSARRPPALQTTPAREELNSGTRREGRIDAYFARPTAGPSRFLGIIRWRLFTRLESDATSRERCCLCKARTANPKPRLPPVTLNVFARV